MAMVRPGEKFRSKGNKNTDKKNTEKLVHSLESPFDAPLSYGVVGGGDGEEGRVGKRKIKKLTKLKY